MNSRQKTILSHIVELYTETAVPVGSQSLLARFKIAVSPATVRNDMAELEDEGYLYQPHVSAGRIPTDEGYRFYVEEMMGDQDLSREDQRRLQKELLILKAKQTRLGRSTVKLLSALSGNLAVSGMVGSSSGEKGETAGREEVYDFGMKDLMENPEFQEIDELCRVVETLDTLDERLDAILEKVKDGKTHIFIGDENPFPGMNNCSMVVAPYTSKEGKGVLAIIGPKRMRYAKNKSLIEYMKKVLGSSLVMVLLSNGFTVVLF